MKKSIITAVILLLSAIAFGQESKTSSRTNKFKLRSIDVSSGIYYARLRERHRKTTEFDNGSIETVESEGYVGRDFSLSTSFSINKNLVSLSLQAGHEIAILYDKPANFYGLNILYGRSWDLAKWLNIENHIGIGLYSITEKFIIENNIDLERKVVMGVPINTKIIFNPTKRFGIGLSSSVNFNSINRIYTLNTLFQYKFN